MGHMQKTSIDDSNMFIVQATLDVEFFIFNQTTWEGYKN
jgi:hypothetical protein